MKYNLLFVLLLAACDSAKTSAVIELQSDFDDAIDDVEVEIRDARDARVLSQASFARDSGPSFQMPFSFGVQPHAASDAFVVKATAHADGREPVTGKLRVSYAPGHTVRRTLFLQSACAGTTCDDGQSCDPVALQCRDVPDSESSAAADGGMDEGAGAGGGSEAPAADGGSGGSSHDDGTHMDAVSAGGHGGQGGHVADTGGMGGAGMSAADGGSDAGVAGHGGAGRAGSAAGAGGARAAGSGGDAGGRGGSSAPGDVGSGTLSEKQSAGVMHDGRNYTVHSNVYGPGALTLDYQGTSFTIASESGSASGGIAAPSVFIGRVYDEGVADDVLPVRVSDLRRLSIEFTHNGDAVDGAFRTLAGVWLSTSASGDPGFASGGTLEVWPYAKPGQTPEGAIQARALSLAGVTGSWDLWVGTYADRPAVAYVRTEALSSVQLDLKPFLDDAAQRPNAIDAAWYVTNVSAGFDIYDGGTGLHIDVDEISAE